MAYRIFRGDEQKNRKKIFALDLDNTIILSRSFFKPAQNENDYIFYSDNVIELLKKKYETNYKIVIFSNQKGVSVGKISLENIINRVDDVIEKIGIPMECYLALKNDKYRKPRIGMFHFMKKIHDCDIEEVIYVGDLANREYDTKFKKQLLNHLKNVYTQNKVQLDFTAIEKKLIKDHSDTDLKFALNMKATFYTPEEIFLQIKNNIPHTFTFDPKKFQIKNNPITIENSSKEQANHVKDSNNTDNVVDIKEEINLKNEEKEIQEETVGKTVNVTKMILLIGPPGCGKSFFCKTKYPDATIISLSKLKTKAKCLDALKKNLSNKKNILIDNENRTIQDRKIYIQAAKSVNTQVQIEAVYFNYSKELVFHLNTFQFITESYHYKDDIPTIPIHSFYKYVEPPSSKEHIDKILTLTDQDFVPSYFESEQHKELFFMYLN